MVAFLFLSAAVGFFQQGGRMRIDRIVRTECKNTAAHARVGRDELQETNAELQ